MDSTPTAEGILRSLGPDDGRGLRSDAQRNRHLVIRAALEIFAEHGALGTIEQVAARAGVGRATVYRTFPNREALQLAVANNQIEQFHQIALEAQRLSAGTGIGLVDFVFGAFRYNQDNRLYIELFEGRPTPDMLEVHTASRKTIGELVDEAQATGVVRADVTVDDVGAFCAGMSRRLATDPSTTPDDWRRVPVFVLRGLGVPEHFLPPHRAPFPGTSAHNLQP